ncbi:hypothetical protein Vadar_015541 [Vaccinium darrowii]|uniref:Uncharacterized protein n=1 Tax=Vaccinium darrowii TaxID=229202 RepID=A0ACB7YEA7_9ERIC|nr:hypothetical protein Vadar_015541 [Vaccinium darrowii]
MAQDHTQRPSQPIFNDLPIARRNSDARFFEKKRQRLASRHPLALQSESEILGHGTASSSEFVTTHNGAHPGRQDQCGSSASHPKKERVRETNKEGRASHIISREVLEQYFGKLKRDDVAKILGESVMKGHVSESGNLVAPSQAASHVLQTVPMTTHMIPQTGGFIETFQLEGQLMQSTSHPNPNALVVPQPQRASTQMLNENMLSLEYCKKNLGLDEETSPEGHVSYARLKVTYRDKTIKFELPLMSGKYELKKEVEKRLELELGSFDLWYKDEDGDGDWIFLGRDEGFRNHLQSFSNQVIKLLIVDKDGNFANCL